MTGEADVDLASSTVFLTGGTGYLGRHVADELHERGADVRALHRSTSDTEHLEELGVTLVEGDVTEPETLEVGDADVVIHLAAWVGFGLPARKQARMEAINVGGTENVLEAALEAGVDKFVHCSTIAAIGDTDGEVADEDTPRSETTFDSFYEETKWRAHRIVRSTPGLATTLPMPGVIVGRHGPFEPLLQVYGRGLLPVRPEGDTPTGFVHVKDVAQGVVAAAERGEGPYLLVDRNLTAGELLEGMGERTGRSLPPIPVGTGLVKAGASLVEALWWPTGRDPPASRELAEGLTMDLRYDSSRAREELGWDPDLFGHLERDVEGIRG
jgi:dihydroflavonol-4-reductase